LSSRANPARRTCSSHLRNTRNPSNPPPPPTINPPPLDITGIQFTCEAHLERFCVLSDRHLHVTRFCDPQVATELGIDDDLQRLFYSVGWQQFLNMHSLSYRRITLEFLSTLKVVRSSTKNPRSISFQLMNESRQLNRNQSNAIFGWPAEGSYGPHSNRPERYGDNTFWNLITGQAVYYPQRAKASGASFLNHAMWLMDHFDEVTRSRDEIAIGGMIFVIALSFGVDLTCQQVIPGCTRLDLKDFQTMGWIANEATVAGYVWKLVQCPCAYLPNQKRTVINIPENWLFALDFPRIRVEESSGEPIHAPESSTQADEPPVPPYAHQLDALRGDIGSLHTEVQLLHQSHTDYVAVIQRSVDVITFQHQEF
ncbi:hypothetical protein BVRB_014930, partial [Beta vulgaris subsp. vulgaris]